MDNLLAADLSAIGFTDYEAKVYLALLREYPATGYQLSKQAGISRPGVYEALGRLEVRGAVLRTEDTKATLYRPMPPDAFLDRLTDEHRRRMEALRQGLQAVYTAVDENYLWTFSGESSILGYAENMITSARREAMLVLADSHVQTLHNTILNAAQRGVSIGAVLTGKENLEIGQIAYHPPHESELHKLANTLVVVVDEQEVLIAGIQATYTATVTTNTNMVQIGRQFVWMELFAHRIFDRIGSELLDRLDPADRMVFEAVAKGIMPRSQE